MASVIIQDHTIPPKNGHLKEPTLYIHILDYLEKGIPEAKKQIHAITEEGGGTIMIHDLLA